MTTQGWIREVTSDSILQKKRSDTIFILGSGYSINELTSSEIKRMEQHDTFSFNWFVYQNFIRIDFHLIREIASDDWNQSVWQKELQIYSDLLKKSVHYKNTLFVLQVGWNSIRIIAHHYLPEAAEVIFYYADRKGTRYPTTDFKLGIIHGPSTLFDSIHFAYLFGWKKIVLVGVDLYDRRYFWLKPDETRVTDVKRNKTYHDTHNTAREVVVWTKRWGKYLEKKGIELFVYNPMSLLAGAIQVFNPNERL